MANQLYNSSNNSTSSKSTMDTSRYFPSLSSDRSFAASTALWPPPYSFDFSTTKRPLQALYNHSSFGVPVIGQSEAWFSSDSLAKRPRLENASNLPIYPQRPAEKDCAHYMLTRTCKFGDSCKFDHPLWVPMGGIPDWKELPSVPSESHPERPGEPDCPYFLKTRNCKFGLNCKFNHPKDKQGTPTKTDASDLPERPSEPVCAFYLKTGKCKFATACKFHHPKDIKIPSDGQEASNIQQSNAVDNVSAINDENAVKTLASKPASSYNSKGLPIRLGVDDCPFYMKTGSCKYGTSCRYNHPDRIELFSSFSSFNSPAAVVGHSGLTSPLATLNVGLVSPVPSVLQSLQPRLAQTTFGAGAVFYPQRPGQMECDYFMKTGVCKFGERCRFHHPMDRSETTRQQIQEQNVKLSLAGLPRREGVLHCPFYMKTGTCSYGVTCKFDHPPPGEVMALAGKEPTTTDEEEAKENGETGKTTKG